jgi:DNA gyrase/topoisomerase IV subunit A
MNLFEYATRSALRFTSSKGALTTEQLWDLPLQSKTGFDLDNVAKSANAELKALTDDSFVATVEAPGKLMATSKLEIVKHIISVRLAENEAARSAAARKAEREKLLEILGDKQDEALKSLSADEIKQRLIALG